MTAYDSDWLADLQRYPERPFKKEQSIWAIWVYRMGRRLDSRKSDFLHGLLTKAYWMLYRLSEIITGISLPKAAKIGPGLRIYHFGNIIIHPEVHMGSNCTIRHGVTIGNRVEGGPVPVIGDNVDFGAYAQVLGDVRIGNNCRIGAMSVVLSDVPNDCTAVGVPARIVHPSSKVVGDLNSK